MRAWWFETEAQARAFVVAQGLPGANVFRSVYGKMPWFVNVLTVAMMILINSSSFARDPAQVRAFRKLNPCPSTGKTTGACKGWVVDHKIPLCAGGPDRPENMRWENYEESLLKDKWEREICAFLKNRQ